MSTRPPVALFVYARPDHTRATLAALAKNDGAGDTDLVVFADGARGEADRAAVEEVRRIVAGATGFRSVRVEARTGNIGLADNIVSGVTALMESHGRVIVLEDDIVTARGYLDFMKAGLDRFADDPKVWHVSGWIYDVDLGGVPDYFLWPVMNCWGWATWADRWAHFERDPDALLAGFDRDRRREFDFDDSFDFTAQVKLNAHGFFRTWAVFWYATLFQRSGLCLTPARSLVQNIGLDGSGENCTASGTANEIDLDRGFEGLPAEIGRSDQAEARIKAAYQVGRLRRLVRALKLERRLRYGRPRTDR